MTHLLGLTGSIGMGKSTTAQMFRDCGIAVWDADATVHELYGAGGVAVIPIRKIFPSVVSDDAVDRDKLRALIQADPDTIKTLEEIVHPLVAKNREEFLRSNHAPLLVFDIPLLFETGADKWLSSVLVVTAPAEIQKQRVLSRNTMTETQFEMIMSRQMPDAEKRARADHIIETLSLDDTRAAVQKLIHKLKGE